MLAISRGTDWSESDIKNQTKFLWKVHNWKAQIAKRRAVGKPFDKKFSRSSAKHDEPLKAREAFVFMTFGKSVVN